MSLLPSMLFQGLVLALLYSTLRSTWSALNSNAVSALIFLTLRGTSLDRLTT